MVTRDALIAAARSFIGTRWLYRGRDRSGLDCIGLLLVTSRAVGLPCEDTELNYKRTPDFNLFKDMIRKQTHEGSMQYLQSASIVMMNQGMFPCHAGIVVLGPQPTLIHAAVARRKVVEEPLENFVHLIAEVREFQGVV